jgi:hypothetical protein
MNSLLRIRYPPSLVLRSLSRPEQANQEVRVRTMTEVWMGYTTVAHAKADERLILAGDRQLEDTLQIWLGSSRFAKMEKCVA